MGRYSIIRLGDRWFLKSDRYCIPVDNIKEIDLELNDGEGVQIALNTGTFVKFWDEAAKDLRAYLKEQEGKR